MAAIDDSMDKVFQDWDDKKVTLHKSPVEQMAQQLGPWAKLVGQRLEIFGERWRPDRMKIAKKLKNDANATADQVRGQLGPVAKEDFISDLRAWGIPDRNAHQAGGLVDVK
ncbi:MAG TPA: hypothetical protein VIM11_03960 [Tepidisphaeraceae bacterium]